MDFGRLITAMVTPFTDDLEVDYNKVNLLVDYLIEQGNDGLVVGGTTGESPNLTKAEKIKLFETVIERAQGKLKIIAGTGSNNTKESIELTQAAEKLGVDGAMLVVPYYNKPSDEGLYQHFKAIAESTKLPIMLYNVPGRTSLNMKAATVVRLAKIENICCIKEASGDLAQVTNILLGTDDKFLVYSGDDSNTLPMLAVGGHGVVSVAGHVIGNEIKAMINDYIAGNVEKAAKEHQRLMPIFEGMFITSNPVPVKAALNQKGIEVGSVRPPLVGATPEQQQFVKNLLQE
ncbi:4-hydroxy-tetrahydrodipicolinate synthase [Desulfuribacillus alkaliarsenatis]|uniref:4-hydroxy-tetrahydrodipicolinate synthase n=1 Tax=Desulfuribacillus alkaliarsenatis TaxID=766136 RepID=A0A1E5G660_9FIRM|nr:4-hydroxy-tetrahydrodipicolinate synthase [Desulfuribacillus alkaliarsenatis]OEF98661.1 4-hydroxy-tetrahydrodipicolinate synthase [Desulfuribacillus alkaliarsenatis]